MHIATTHYSKQYVAIKFVVISEKFHHFHHILLLSQISPKLEVNEIVFHEANKTHTKIPFFVNVIVLLNGARKWLLFCMKNSI